MIIDINRKTIIWSYTAQILNYGSGLILLPLILTKFNPEEIGLWYIFLGITSISVILDFGFLPNITRTISYIYSGAQSVTKEGLPETNLKNPTEINYNLLKSVISVVKKIYRTTSFSLAFLLFIGGTIYLRGIILSNDYSLWLAFYSLFKFILCLL
jgi:hypothetical protein